MQRLSSLLILVVLAVCACSQSDLIEKFAPVEIREKSVECITDLRTKQFEGIKVLLAPELRNSGSDRVLEKMAAFFPATPPTSTKLVGCHALTSGGVTTYQLAYEYQFDQKWILVSLAWQQSNPGLRLKEFHVTPLAGSIEQANAFTFRGKGGLHYLVLALAIFVFSLSVYALVACIRTKNLKRKWLWIIFILFGFGAFSFNWSSGGWAVSLINFQLLSVGAFAPLYGTWTITVSIPVGAVVFLDKLRQRRKSEAASVAA